MEFTKDEINRFLALVTNNAEATRFLSFDGGHIKTFDIVSKNNETKDYVYDTHIMVLYEHEMYADLIYFKDEADIVFSDNDLKFIKSIIDRRLDGLSLIYKSDLKMVYEEDIKNSRIKITDESFNDNNYNVLIVISGRCYSMTRYDADLSDDAWNVLYHKKDLMLEMLKYYMKDTRYFSPKIQKRIQAYYDSLSDSDKLLLEVGEDIDI